MARTPNQPAETRRVLLNQRKPSASYVFGYPLSALLESCLTTVGKRINAARNNPLTANRPAGRALQSEDTGNASRPVPGIAQLTVLVTLPPDF